MAGKKKTARQLLDGCIEKAIVKTDEAIDVIDPAADKSDAALGRLISCLADLDKLVGKPPDQDPDGVRTGVVLLPRRLEDDGNGLGE